MKRFLLFILAANLLIPASAHKYLQHGLSWQRTHYERVWDYTLSMDTVINGAHYLSGEWLGLYRDDQTGIYEYNPNCNKETLVFPYGAQVGDTLHISNLSIFHGCDTLQQGVTPGWGDYYGVVTSVDTVTLLNGEQRRRIFYSGGRHNWYIEGIGGPKGWRCETVDWELDDTDVWLCYYIDSTLIWASDDCEQWQSKFPTACLGYTPLKTADTWHAVSYENAYGEIKVTGVQYSLGSDTVLNRRHYRKIMENNRYCVGGIRQSEDGLKVYFHGISPWSYTPNMQECLLYDFSANVGDTLNDAYFRKEDMTTYIDWMGEPESLGWIVTEKDTIDGRIHMAVERYYADSDSVIIRNNPNHYAFKTHWIQGVGTPNVLWPKEYGTSAFNTLYTLCAMRGDETLYTYNLESLKIENNCTEWRYTAIDDIQADDHSPRKFLLDGQLFIETPLGTFNTTGQQISY